MCKRNLFRSYIRIWGQGRKEEKANKIFRYFTCRYGKSGWLYYRKFIHVYYIHTYIHNIHTYIYIYNTCVYTRHTFTYPRKHMLLSIYMRLETFYKYYKGTVIRVHDTYRRVSKEGLITQAPFCECQICGKWRVREKRRECERMLVCACMCKKVRERESIESQHSFWILGSLSLITFQTSSCRVL